MRDNKKKRGPIATILIGILAGFGALFFIGIIIGIFGVDSEDVVETVNEHRKEVIEEDDDSNDEQPSDDSEEPVLGDTFEQDGITYYSLKLDDGSEVGVALPKCITNDNVDNLTAERRHKIAKAIYDYDNDPESYILYIPNEIETVEDIVKNMDSIGNIYNLTVELRGTSKTAVYTYGTSSDYTTPITIDDTYIEVDEKQDLFGDETINYDAVYAGLYGSHPIFIALNMEVQ